MGPRVRSTAGKCRILQPDQEVPQHFQLSTQRESRQPGRPDAICSDRRAPHQRGELNARAGFQRLPRMRCGTACTVFRPELSVILRRDFCWAPRPREDRRRTWCAIAVAENAAAAQGSSLPESRFILICAATLDR